jgi:cystathionine gamma-lyase
MPNDVLGYSSRSKSTRLRSTDGFATRAIRAGQDPCSSTGSTIVPIYQTATFTVDAPGVDRGFDYSRTANPTRSAFEQQIAALEGGAFGLAFASGMAAVAAACAPLRTGDHMLATDDLYGGTYRFFVDVLTRYGIDVEFVDTTNSAAVARALRPATKLLWVETPTNPLLRLADVRAIAAIKGPGRILAVDNTFCSPVFQRPLELGADLVLHSTTKYVNGHSDAIGGALVVDDPELFAALAFYQNAAGAVLGPQDAYLTLRGSKTLALRMRQHEHSATEIAQWLENRDDVEAVYYPGLQSHPQRDLVLRQQHGAGGVLSFRVRGGSERARRVACSTRLFNLAVSLGGVESLICVPSTMTHKAVPDGVKRELGVTPDLIRLSVGLEDTEDLIGDLELALDLNARLDREIVA